MPEEKKTNTAELSDEQMDRVTGGGLNVPTGNPGNERRCANPNCREKLAEGYTASVCPKCIEAGIFGGSKPPITPNPFQLPSD